MENIELERYILERQQELAASRLRQEFHLIVGDYTKGFADYTLGKAFEQFMCAVFDKAKRAQIKYGFGPLGWATPDWEQDLQRGIAEHVQKGDPRDVAVYAMFAWFHGWNTALPAPKPNETLQGLVAAIELTNASPAWKKNLHELTGIAWVETNALISTNARLVQETHNWSAAVKKLEAERVAATSISGDATAELLDEYPLPEYHAQGMGCGLEDRGITDRYEAMQYGWGEAIQRVENEVIEPLRAALAASPSALTSPQQPDGWIRTADGKVPTEFDPDDEFFSRKMIVCIDGKVSTEPGYYTKSGRWIIAGRHGDAVNVTHWREYPSDPQP